MRRRSTDRGDQEYWGEWLSRAIANSSKNQSELADYAGVTNPQVTRWKAGQAPSVETCKKIADFFDADPLRLAVTTGRIPTEIAGVERLPLPDDSAQRIAEREAIQYVITNKLSRDRDRKVLLHALEALKARDTMDGVTSEEKLADALRRTEDAVDALTDLLRPPPPEGSGI